VRQLIACVLEGDAAAERQLYDIHVDRVYGLSYRMTGDQSMAEEYTQESFIKVFTRLKDFQGRSTLSTWIHSVTVSVVLSGLRKVKRIRNRETEFDGVVEEKVGVRSPDVALKIRLHTAIDALPAEMRIVFLMHDLEGFKHHEIADILDVPVGTTKSRLSRARQTLRFELGDEWRHSKEERN
jgi:RNA polymerase sigma-70 factor (ECF subfamily)